MCSGDGVEKMSLSRLIKGGDAVGYQISDFDLQGVRGGGDPPPREPGGRGPVKLPGGPSPGLGLSRPEKLEESSEERLARLEREAYEKGFEQGRKDGLDLERKHLEEQRQEAERIFAGLRELKAVIARDTEEDLLSLCKLISRRIVREEVKTDPEVILRALRAALDFVVDKTCLKISVNPQDMEKIRHILPELASSTEGETFQVVEDRALARGGCLIETGFGRINATVEDQCAVVEKVIDEAFRGRDAKEP